jgi:site-specific recombinase XerD
MGKTVRAGGYRYLRRKKGRGGTVHLYYEEPGKARIALRGPIGSQEFEADYRAAQKAAPLPKQDRTQPYTLAALIIAYQGSQAFRSLAASTQEVRRRILSRIGNSKYGRGDLRDLNRGAVTAVVRDMANGPEAARNLLKILNQLVKLAIALGWRDDNPIRDIERPRSGGNGRHCWTDAEIAQYRKRWPLGTRQRLAMDLLLLAGQRKGDVVKLTPDNIRGSRLRISQEKTGVEIDAPIQPELRASIAATTTGLKAVLVSSRGKPYGTKAFCGVFRDWCDAAGLPARCSAHGLRKAFARRMAENGATAHEIMAAGGWATLAEVQRYTKAADRKRLADSGMAKTASL